MSKQTVNSLARMINNNFRKDAGKLSWLAYGVLDETLEIWRNNWKMLCTKGKIYVLPRLFPIKSDL